MGGIVRQIKAPGGSLASDQMLPPCKLTHAALKRG